jgi:hypothetical protein
MNAIIILKYGIEHSRLPKVNVVLSTSYTIFWIFFGIPYMSVAMENIFHHRCFIARRKELIPC